MVYRNSTVINLLIVKIGLLSGTVFLLLTLNISAAFPASVQKGSSIASSPVSYGFQFYLDNRKISNGVPTGATWPITLSPFTSESAMFDFLAVKGFTYSRVMLIMPNVLDDGGFARYKAYDKQLFLTHMQMWQSKGIRTVLALRDYEYYTVPERASLLLDMYRTCRQAGLNPVLTLGNEPGNKVSLPSGYRFTPAEFRRCADLVIPTLQAEYPGTFEWWGPGTADLDDFQSYMDALGPWIPTRRACHTYDGAVVDGSLPMAAEVNRSLANLSEVNSAPWVMEEWSPYSTQYEVHSPEWNTERLRQFTGVMDNNCNIYIFWAANVGPRMCISTTELAPWVVEALAYRPVSTPTPGPPQSPTPEPTKTPTPVEATATEQPESTPTITPFPDGSVLYRINAGGNAYTDTQNLIWSADQPFSAGSWGYVGGNTYTVSRPITGTEDDVLYQSERWGMTAYRFTVLNGRYEVTLHFAEIYFDGVTKGNIGSRVFDVSLEQSLMLTDYDLLAVIGANRAKTEIRQCTVEDGILDVGFVEKADHAKLNAIEIRQAIEETPTPTPTPTSIPATLTPTATNIPATPTPSPSNTPIPSTATPSSTVTPVPATATLSPTHTAIPLTATPTRTLASTATPPRQVGDLTGDGRVDSADLFVFIAHWGQAVQ